MRQNTQNITYITTRIDMQNNKNTEFTQTEAHKTYNHIHNDKKVTERILKNVERIWKKVTKRI
jgi:tellurite resistance protein